MSIIRKEIRRSIWTYLKNTPSSSQITHIGQAVADVIGREEAVKNAHMVLEEVYDMLNKGLIIFWNGAPATNAPSAYPWITLTEYGKKCLEAESLMPFDPDGYIDKVKEMVQKVQGEISLLPPKQRKVVFLSRLQLLDIDTIAKKLNCSPMSVYVAVKYGLDRLRQVLKREYD